MVIVSPEVPLGAALSGARKLAATTQAELASAIGTSQCAVSLIESGDRDPRWSTVLAICRALDSELSYQEPDP